MPADFLDEIDFAQQIDTKGWCHHVPPVGLGHYGESEGPQNALDVRIRHRRTKEHREPRSAQVETRCLSTLRVHIDERTHNSSRANLLHERRDAIERDDWRIDIGPAS